MWLAKQQKREVTGPEGSVGEVTIAGEAPSVELDSERRELTVFAPGGYRWRPTEGQKVLVLKADGEYRVAGAESGGGLEPGEVALDSAGGAFIRLDNQGGVALGSGVTVSGPLYVDGEELTQLIQRIAGETAAALLGG